MRLSRTAKIYSLATALAAGTTDHQGDIVPMAGADSVMFIAKLGAVSSSAYIKVIPQGSLISTSSTGLVDLTEGAVGSTGGTTDDSQRMILCDIHAPGYPYVSAKLDRGEANAAVDALLAVTYVHDRIDISQSTDHVAYEGYTVAPSTGS